METQTRPFLSLFHLFPTAAEPVLILVSSGIVKEVPICQHNLGDDIPYASLQGELCVSKGGE